MIEIEKIVLETFNEYIKISDKRQLKPFKKVDVDAGKYFPKKYQNTDIYTWNNDGKLIYKETKKLVPKNSKVVGQPRYWKINGQDIYNQKISQTHRAVIMNKLHALFEPLFKEIKSLQNFPVGLRINFYTIDEGKFNIDNDNKWIWEKVIQDSMSRVKYIPDDSPKYINENIKKTIFVEDKKDTKIEIIIYKEDEGN